MGVSEKWGEGQIHGISKASTVLHNLLKSWEIFLVRFLNEFLFHFYNQ